MSAIKDGIKTLFNELDRHSKIVKFESVKAEDNFAVLVRTKFTNAESWGKTCNEWLEKFVAQTNSKWVVKTTFPKLQRLEYRKIYVCKENSVSSRNRNRSCDAKIDIKVKRITDNTLKKDKLLGCGYNAEIKLQYEMARFIAQIIVAGSQIVARAFARAVKEEIAASQDAARRLGNNKTRAERLTNTKLGLSLEEAKQILNVTEMTPEQVAKRHDALFKANEKSNGGSFYIQSKVVRAKERIDAEFKEAESPTQPQADKT